MAAEKKCKITWVVTIWNHIAHVEAAESMEMDL